MIRRVILLLMAMMPAFTALTSGQEYPDWSGFPPMYAVRDVVWYEGLVYAVTDAGMFEYDPGTREYRLLYKNNGLEYTRLRSIAATSQYLYIGYAEQGLWRFDPRNDELEIVSFPEYHLKTSSNPTGIAVNTIYVKNDSILYVGHANGLDRLNISSEELRVYSNLGGFPENTPVNGISIHNDSLWVATSQGLAVADEGNPNLEFSVNWRSYTRTNGGNTGGVPVQTSAVMYVEDESETAVYLAAPNYGILRYDYAADALMSATNTFKANDMIEAAGAYWAVGIDGLTRKDGMSWGAWLNRSYTYLDCIAVDDAGRLWIGSESAGLQCYTGGEYADIPPESRMRSDTFYSMSLSPDGVLWAATSDRDSDTSPPPVVQRYDGETWSIYDAGYPSWSSTGVAILADTPDQTWVASWGKLGLNVIEDDGFPDTVDDNIYRTDPSAEIIKPTIDPWYFVCTDLAKDEQGNIWVANFQLDPPGHVLEDVPSSGVVVVDGYPITRYAHYSPAEDDLRSAEVMKICSTKNGWIWAGTWSQGLTGMYTGPDPFDKSDTVVQHFTRNEGLLAMRITALAADSQGNLWVGTEAGLNLLIPGSGNRYDITDLNDALDENNRDIRSITFDDRNNTWVGTAAGLVKLNNRNETEAVYTIDNSGLFSNVILSLVYDAGRGVLWVGTDLGINRFDMDTSSAQAAAASVHVYPNPFELWGYDSRVVFTNLKAGSPVDIYSFDGVHVNRVTADTETGEAEWSGRNFRDDYVGTGVYFIIGTDFAGNTFRDKMIVMRR